MRVILIPLLVACTTLALTGAPLRAANVHPESPPLDPGDALETIHVPDGYSIELVAAEPLVQDPVAIAWGPDGRLWVAEMADYPLGLDGEGQSGGRIRVLEDTDEDGRYDRSTVFLEGVAFPNGVLPWRNGVLVTSAPEIIFAEDTDGDGVADQRTVLIRGFQAANQQLRVNGLRRGLDNWIHGASGAHNVTYGAASQVESVATGESLDLGSRDFRFRPDTGELEPQSGPTQFGRNRDEWGNWYGCMNSYPLWHYVLPDHYLRRNPHLTPPDTRRQLVLPRNPRVYPAKAPQKRFHSYEQTGRFTSACGGMIYRDKLLFPRDGRLHGFTCEPFHNLVQHNVIEEDGVSFRGYRDDGEGETDFFASSDRWCRPVMVRTGPDGALWVVDMYRYIIEHPQFLTDVGRDELEPFYRAGHDRGRIYRIFPNNKRPRPVPRLDRMETAELVTSLVHPNGPVRDMAQRRLVTIGAEDADLLLEQLIAESESPLARLHALWTLEGLDRLTAAVIERALDDEHPGVRRHALRLSEKFTESHPQLLSKITALADDPHPHVRLQLAFTLGQWPGNESARALARLSTANAGDPHFDAAILSSVHENNIARLVDATLSDASSTAAAHAGDLAGRLLALTVAFEKPDATLTGLGKILERETIGSTATWQYGVVAGLLDALKQHDSSLEEIAAASPSGPAVLEKVAVLMDHARQTALEPESKLAPRAVAVRLMARDASAATREEDIVALGELLDPTTPPALQSAAITHLATLSDPAAATALLAGWKGHGPAVRTEILGVIPSRKDWMAILLDEIEAGAVPAAHIGPYVQQNLRRQAGKDGRARLAKIFAEAASGTAARRDVLASYQPALELTGDRSRGMEHFKIACSACHRLDDVGQDVGPNLTSISDRRPEALLTAILDPNAQLDARYATYVATTRDGRALTGFLAAETANSIALIGADNLRHNILRSDLQQLESTGLSLMPEGLEAALDHQAIADLIAYIARAGLPK